MSDQYVGEIRLFSFSRIPSGWLACDGSLQSIAQNQILYTLLGTTYGGDGVTTFGLPDLRGQVPVHQGTGQGLTRRPIGSFGGSETVTLLSPQLPSHTHPMNATSAAATSQTPSNAMTLGTIGNGDTFYISDTSGATALQMNVQCVTSQGGNQPHENTMPTLAASFCICTMGLFPTRAS